MSVASCGCIFLFGFSRGDDNHGDGIDAVIEYYFQGRDRLWIRRQTLLKSHLQLIYTVRSNFFFRALSAVKFKSTGDLQFK